MMRRACLQKKSTTNGPMGCWRRNLARMTCRPRNICQSKRSAGVERRRRSRAMEVEGLGSRGMHAYRRPGADGCYSTILPDPLRPGEGLGGEVDFPNVEYPLRPV